VRNGGSISWNELKMLCLYLDTLKIGHILSSMLSILNEIALLFKWPHFITNNGFGLKSKNATVTNTTQQQDNKRKHPCQSWEPNPIRVTSIGHRANCT